MHRSRQLTLILLVALILDSMKLKCFRLGAQRDFSETRSPRMLPSTRRTSEDCTRRLHSMEEAIWASNAPVALKNSLRLVNPGHTLKDLRLRAAMQYRQSGIRR